MLVFWGSEWVNTLFIFLLGNLYEPHQHLGRTWIIQGHHFCADADWLCCSVSRCGWLIPVSIIIYYHIMIYYVYIL